VDVRIPAFPKRGHSSRHPYRITARTQPHVSGGRMGRRPIETIDAGKFVKEQMMTKEAA